MRRKCLFFCLTAFLALVACDPNQEKINTYLKDNDLFALATPNNYQEGSILYCAPIKDSVRVLQDTVSSDHEAVASYVGLLPGERTSTESTSSGTFSLSASRALTVNAQANVNEEITPNVQLTFLGSGSGGLSYFLGPGRSKTEMVINTLNISGSTFRKITDKWKSDTDWRTRTLAAAKQGWKVYLVRAAVYGRYFQSSTSNASVKSGASIDVTVAKGSVEADIGGRQSFVFGSQGESTVVFVQLFELKSDGSFSSI